MGPESAPLRILYVTQWFEPEPAFKGLEFAKALSQQGFEVEVATGYPNYPGGKLYPGYHILPFRRETLDGLTVFRLPLYPSHGHSSIGRALNYVSFFISVLMFGLVRAWRYDAVYVYHPPITPAFATALFGFVWRTPFLVDVQDLWPDSAFASGMVPWRLGRALSGMCDFVYRRAAFVICQSQGIAERVIARGIHRNKVNTVYNWSTYRPEEVAGKTPEADAAKIIGRFRGSFNFVYGGNLGQAQGLDTVILAAVKAAKTVPNLKLHLVGGGIEADRLRSISATIPGEIVQIHDPVSRSAMDRVFDAADALILHLKADPLYDITIPSKVQHYLSCGKPIVAGVGGEAGAIINAARAGYVIGPENVLAMGEAMVQMATTPQRVLEAMGDDGKTYYAERMSIECGIFQTTQMLKIATRYPI